MAINVFISYDYTTDIEYASLLKAWAENDAEYFKNIDFVDSSKDFSRKSTKVHAFINSISRRLKNLSLILQRSNIEHANTLPISLYGKGVKWAESFTEAAIESVLT